MSCLIGENIIICIDNAYQPLTRYTICGIGSDDSDEIFGDGPDELRNCHECGDTRYAKDLVVSAGWDYFKVKCADECYSGKGLRAFAT